MAENWRSAMLSPLVSQISLFVLGLVILLVSAELLILFSKQLAYKFRISPLVISLIIVAFGTNLPEFVVTIGAILQSDPGLALGNSIGSSIVNITLLLGLAGLFQTVKLGTVKTQKNMMLLLLCTVLFVLLPILGISGHLAAFILLGTLLIVLSYQLLLGFRGRKAEDKQYFKHLVKEHNFIVSLPGIAQLSLAVISIVGLWAGGSLTASSVGAIATISGLTSSFIGLTLTAIATSLPELITVLTASVHRQNKVVIGTLLGSNIFNLTISPALIFATTSATLVFGYDLAILLLATLVVTSIFFRFRGKVLPKKISILLLAIYLVFLCSSVYQQF